MTEMTEMTEIYYRNRVIEAGDTDEAARGVSTYRNPVLPGFYPDPSICRVEDDFYLVTSSFQYFPGVPVFHSRDLISWKQIGHCLTRASQLDLEGCPSSLGIFAPTLRYGNGRFYMITTNMNGFRNFLVWADRPEGPWSEPVWLDWPGIDPSLFFDEDGRVYITGNGGFRGDEPSGIYQAEIEPESGRLLSERRFIWAGTGGQAPEGPHLYKRGNHYYLLVAEGGTQYGHMATIARSSSPYGPFEGSPDNPVLTHRSLSSSIQAIGHADLVELADGSWWAVFLGIRPAPVPFAGQHHHLGRETFLAPVTWPAEGWPMIGEHGVVSEVMNVSSLPVLENAAPPDYFFRDEFGADQLADCWNFLRNPAEGSWSLTEHPGSLTLHGSETTLDAAASPAFAGVRQRHFHCTVSVQLTFGPVQEGEEAGLSVYMDEKFHYEIALTFKDGVRKVLFRRRIGTLWKVEREEVYRDAERIIFTVDADPANYSFSYATPGGEKTAFGRGECSLISTETAGGFTGVYFGLYATGNGQRCSVPAVFEWFEYAPGEPE